MFFKKRHDANLRRKLFIEGLVELTARYQIALDECHKCGNMDINLIDVKIHDTIK